MDETKEEKTTLFQHCQLYCPSCCSIQHENSMGVQINNLRIPCTHNFLFCMILMRTDLKYNEVCNYLYHLDVHMSSERKAKGI